MWVNSPKEGVRSKSYMDFAGKVRIRSISLADNAVHDDINSFKHDIDGVVSVPNGGKTFDFTIAPKPNPDLDLDHVVIGRVVNGLDVIYKINDVPVSREDSIGTKQAFSNLGKNFDGRAKLASVDRPLQKVTIQQCQVEEKSTISSFMKF